ncbi:MAG: hypothetical protein HRT47_01635 [Candidatus Caenarcaniphilales bacterium]|nr:hypothetical protein [Candidatus Caenarcaniphilales bacterium]
MFDDETYSSEGVKCPHCGFLHKACEDDNWEWLYPKREEPQRTKCESCNREIEWECIVSHEWSATVYEN